MPNLIAYFLTIGTALASSIYLTGCLPIPLPPQGEANWSVDEGEVQSLLNANRTKVENKLGSPTYIGYSDGALYTIYEALGEEGHLIVAFLLFPFELNKYNTAYCLLLEYDTDETLQEYSYLSDSSRKNKYYSYEGEYSREEMVYSYDCLDLMQVKRPNIDWTANYPALRERAKADDPGAQLKLFELDRETSEGKKWLCLAADQGCSQAQVRLADSYYHGWFNVPSDKIRSYAWFTMASRKKDEWGRWAAKLLESRFDDFTDAQLSEAKELLDAWKPNQCGRDLVLNNGVQ